MKILLALDPSTDAMDEAIRLASEKQANLTALFVMDTTWNDYTGHDWLSGSGSRADFLEYARDDELSSEADIISKFRKRCDLKCEIKTVAGRVTSEILHEMNRVHYDLLVMSHPFRRGLEIVRDAAGVILKQANCSVYLVRESKTHCPSNTIADLALDTASS